MKIKRIEEDKIVFDDDSELRYYHDQDCCEHVYADFMYIKDYNCLGKNKNETVFELEFDLSNLKSKIEIVKDEGICLLDKNNNKIFIPCYDVQNGYYSSELELKYYIKENEKHKFYSKLDISESTKYIDA